MLRHEIVAFAAPDALGTPAPDVSASPAAAPSPAYKHKRGLFGDGPIEVSGIGSGDVGFHKDNSIDTSAQTRSLEADMAFNITRRTEQTSINITQSVSEDGTTASIAQLGVSYRTPKYGLIYGPLVGPSDTQLGIGGFQRGLSLSIPERNGELDFLASSGEGTSGETFRAFGVRRGFDLGRGRSLSLTQLNATGESGGGTSDLTDISFSSYGASRIISLEVAADRTEGIFGDADGLHIAYAGRLDQRGNRGDTQFTYLDTPLGFAPIGLIASGDRDFDTASSRRIGVFQLQGDFDRSITTDSTGSSTIGTRLDGGLSFPVRILGAVTLNGSRGDSATVGGDTQNSTLSAGANQNVKGFALAETYGRSTVNGVSSSSYTNYAFALSHLFLGGQLATQSTYQKSESNGLATILSENINYARGLGPHYDIGVQGGLQVLNTAGVPSSTRTLGVTLTRHLSRALSLQVNTTRTFQTGPGGGAGSTLDVELVGPIAFGGAAQYGGRINPNLPAVLQGRVVYQDIAFNAVGGPLSTRGVANVLVVVDGGQAQRTDANGGYEFRFIKPGTHVLSLQEGTVPLGLVAEHDTHEVVVQGGQVVTTDFLVGNYGGVRGRVTTVGAGGEVQGLAGVGILIDATQRMFTIGDGSFQLGKLSTGAHTVEVVTDTLPASAAIVETKRSVQVRQGALSVADFQAVRLGAIHGTVFLGDPLQNMGARDVYVVAQPGDHAAITFPDGTFELDNLPPGTYQLAVDPQTLPDDAQVLSGDGQTHDVGPGADVMNAVFSIGEAAKDVVFDFTDKKKAALQVTIDPLHAPTLGAVDIRVTTSAPKTAKAEAQIGASVVALHPDGPGVFVGRFVVPLSASAGDLPMHITIDASSSDSILTVDPKVPLVSTRIPGTRVIPGQTIHVVMKTYADVRAGDTLSFPGEDIKLPEPHSRVFGFNLRVTAGGLPMRGTMTTRGGEHVQVVIDRPKPSGGKT